MKKSSTKSPKSSRRVDVLVGTRIRQRRESLGMSQKDLADAIGVTDPMIHRYEIGTNRLSASRLHAIADALSTSVSRLLGTADAKSGCAATARPEARKSSDGLSSPMTHTQAKRLVRAFEGIGDARLRSRIIQFVEQTEQSLQPKGRGKAGPSGRKRART
jgi:transcriptional regulator with XRE-family HTH domain